MVNSYDVSESMALARGSVSKLRSQLAVSPQDSKVVAEALFEIERTLDSMRSRYGLFREVLYRTNDIVFAKDLDGRYVMMNPRGEEFFGRPLQEVLGRDDSSLINASDAQRTMERDANVMRTGVAQTYEDTFVSHDGSNSLITTTSCWYDEARVLRGVIGVSQDVTARRQYERTSDYDRLRMNSVLSETVIAEERLRRSLAAELHNGLAQDIALAKLKLAQMRATADKALEVSLTDIESLIEQADRSLHEITFQISPPSLHDLGLVAALEWLAEDMARTRSLTVHVDDQDSPAVEDEHVRVILFRAVRELLVNAAKHADVRAATVRLIRLGSQVCITVNDAGVGFETKELATRGLGLYGMRRQLEYVGGTLNVHSTVGRGTSVTVTAPTKALNSDRLGHRISGANT